MMSKKERKEMAAARKRLIEQGVLPERKKPVNRKKYASEVLSRVENFEDKYFLETKIAGNVISSLINSSEKTFKMDDDEYAMARIVDLSLREIEFLKKLKDDGRDKYTLGEYMEEVYYKVYPKPVYRQKGENSDD